MDDRSGPQLRVKRYVLCKADKEVSEHILSLGHSDPKIRLNSLKHQSREANILICINWKKNVDKKIGYKKGKRRMEDNRKEITLLRAVVFQLLSECNPHQVEHADCQSTCGLRVQFLSQPLCVL